MVTNQEKETPKPSYYFLGVLEHVENTLEKKD